MFNWICPECGRDVSPSESECRFCAERKKAAEVAVPAGDPAAYGAPPPSQPVSQQYYAPLPPQQQPQPYAPVPPQQQPYAPPPQQQQPMYAPSPTQQPYPPPPQQYYAPPQQPPSGYYPPGAYPPPKKSLPTWALALLFGVAFIAIIGAVFLYFGRSTRAERAGVTEPAAAARSKPSNPLQKYIDVVGIRLVQDARHRPQAKFIVVNHSSTELNGLSANVTLYASTSRSEEDSVGTFSFKIDSIAGNESKEMTEPFTTKLKIYELPDWQNATADVQLTQP
jgi:hypothetical protein